MSQDAINQLADALSGAINSQSKSHLARITSMGSNGVIQAYSETLGTVRVLAKTTDDLAKGDNIYITKSAAEKNSPYIYAGFASAAGGSRTQPGVSASAPVQVPAGNDQQPGGTTGTLQYVLDELRREIRRTKGTPTWLDDAGQDLLELLHIRSPVDLVTHLPSVAALDDLRYVRAANQWYVYALAGWIPVGGTAQGGNSGGTIVQRTVGAGGIGAIKLVSDMPTGLVLADATSAAQLGRVLGVTIESAAPNNTVPVQLDGIVQFASPIFGTYRGTLVVGVNGIPTATLPTSAYFAQQIGSAVDSNTMALRLDSVFIL